MFWKKYFKMEIEINNTSIIFGIPEFASCGKYLRFPHLWDIFWHDRTSMHSKLLLIWMNSCVVGRLSQSDPDDRVSYLPRFLLFHTLCVTHQGALVWEWMHVKDNWTWSANTVQRMERLSNPPATSPPTRKWGGPLVEGPYLSPTQPHFSEFQMPSHVKCNMVRQV